MFAGIVESVKPILSVVKGEGVLRISVEKPTEYDDLKNGDSVAVNGVCLTVESFDQKQMQFALAAETLQVLQWKDKTPAQLQGVRVNLERSLQLGERIHGHLTTGHVEGLGRVVRRDFLGESLFLDVELGAFMAPFLWRKGSLTLNGVSLTINEVKGTRVSVCLIPETQKRTNLAEVSVGEFVTVEPDYLARAVGRALAKDFKREN